MIRVAITAIALCIAGVTKAQTYVPPVFGADSLNIHTDEMTRLYVPPQKVMWISNDSLVSNAEVLLLSGTGQAELGRKSMCSMHTTKSDTASILLDYGVARRLKTCIRFGKTLENSFCTHSFRRIRK